MKKFLIPLIVIFISIFLFILLYVFKHTPTVQIKGHTFFLEVATTPNEKEIGLAKYKSLEQNKGMYFPYEKADYYAFWMKNMHFPIDILFIRNSKIVTIFPNAPVQKEYEKYIYQPTHPADSVLELSAGISQQYGFKNGDTVYLHL